MQNVTVVHREISKQNFNMSDKRPQRIVMSMMIIIIIIIFLNAQRNYSYPTINSVYVNHKPV